MYQWLDIDHVLEECHFNKVKILSNGVSRVRDVLEECHFNKVKIQT